MCGSEIAVDTSSMQSWTSVSWVLKYSRAKSREPIGEPRRQKPVVSSTGRAGPRMSLFLGLVE